MPTHKVKSGYKWGKSGKIYPTKAQADKQGQAIYASGWRENNIKNVQESKNMAKKQLIRLTEGDLHKIIKESVNRILNENYQDFDSFDNDLNYQSIFNQACDYLMTKNPKTQYWKRIAQDMGFQLQTIGPNDMETMKDAIEDAMRECGDVQDEYYDSRVNLDNTMFRERYGNNNTHDYKGKAAMNALGAYGKEGEEVGQNDSGVGEYDRYDMDESVRRSLREAFSDIYQSHNFEDPNKDYYQSFVIVDSTRAVLGHYDTYQEAVDDAKEMARRYKGGTFEVYGCDEDGYALEENYPEDNTLVYSTDEDFA